ncbi:MAG: 50S ribosomal protein L24 [Pseudomonadota bacterium]
MIRKGDMIVVMTGKEKKKTGKVLKVINEGTRLIVEKLNMVKKHSRPTQGKPTGGIIDKEAPIRLSNTLLFCSHCSKGVKTGIKVLKDKKVRFCKKCEKNI